MFQCFSFCIDAPFKRLTLLLILPDGGSTCLVEFLFVLVQGAGHVTHDAGLTFAGGSDHDGVQAQRFHITWHTLYLILALQADSQRPKTDDGCHVG